MWADFTNASYASSGQLENYVSGGSYSSDSGSPPVPCLHTGDQVLVQLNFDKVGVTPAHNQLFTHYFQFNKSLNELLFPPLVFE